MRPWARWLIDHNLGWTLYAFIIVLSPVFYMLAAVRGMNEVTSDIRNEFKTIYWEIKHKDGP